ncbi:Septin-domain-containing protein [Polychaeton citri CBS 116435]|uniref:Septin-domain-containing protein n=1 Tax=Polychaeton citri CBS 116435 TaxID=1314669 RepID=A0A9P4UTV3_9PEZI|nr:Septin-domain-containing protein [Polychaeton citri CBS 116435]
MAETYNGRERNKLRLPGREDLSSATTTTATGSRRVSTYSRGSDFESIADGTRDNLTGDWSPSTTPEPDARLASPQHSPPPPPLDTEAPFTPAVSEYQQQPLSPPPLPPSSTPFTMAESASPIGIANLPNQRHKIVAKRGAAFTIMVAGESGLGKTTFINTLFSTTIKNYADHRRRHAKQVDKTVEIEITKAELEEKFFKVRLTVIDTPGFGDYVNNRDSWQPIIEFLDDQHESYMLQEQQPRRTEKIDLRVHACLYFIRPTGHTLKPLDIEVMRRLCTRVNLIPVVAKADTLSPADLLKFKNRIRAVIEAQGIKIYQPPLEEDDEAGLHHARSLIAAMPFSVIGSERDVSTPDGRTVKGRQYAWGVAEVENEDHCDFKKLRSILIRTHMLDLIHTTEENHYEAYRAQQMETRKFGEARPRKLDNPKFKEEEEALRKRFTEQVKVEEQRFRQWEQKLIAERDRLNKDLEQSHAVIKQLEIEVEALQSSMSRTGRR